MTFNFYLALAAAILSAGISGLVFFRGSRSFAYRVFTAGMLVLALEQFLLATALLAGSPRDVLYWQWVKSLVGALLPGLWLTFGLSFARLNYNEHLARWKWLIVTFFAFPLILTANFKNFFYVSAANPGRGSDWSIVLGPACYVYNIFVIIAAAVILMILERTLRAFTGSIRWQIKFMIVAVFGLFAIRIYISSQMLLYSAFSMSLESLGSGMLLLADLLIMWALFRSRLMDIDIYLSHSMVYNSITAFLVGIYLMVVGGIAAGISSFVRGQPIAVEVLFLFLAVTALAVVLLSDTLRHRFRQFISEHLQRPQYDYRDQWSVFTQKTATLLDMRDLCASVAKRISETFAVPSVNIWLFDPPRKHLTLGSSTVLSMTQELTFNLEGEHTANLVRLIRKDLFPEDLLESQKDWVQEFRICMPPQVLNGRMRACAPLVAAEELVGFITLSERVTGLPFSFEDFSLLMIMAEQTAGSIRNIRLSEQLRLAKQMEMFQTVAAFFVHDLKNMASTLSLTLQNLPVYFDNPEFRQDTLRVIGQSVEKINGMCGRLSLLRQKLELDRSETDLNHVVSDVLSELNGAVQSAVVTDLQPIPPLLLDSDQMRKVVTNLVLNAKDAIGADGRINIRTYLHGDYAMLSVADNGCGISKDFLDQSLFSPFRTTKEQGLGIGLYQCKMIVEAHQGRIEVESREGTGSTFRVILPANHG